MTLIFHYRPTPRVPAEILARTARALEQYRERVASEAQRRSTMLVAAEQGELQATLLKLFRVHGMRGEEITFRRPDDFHTVAEVWGCSWWLVGSWLVVALPVHDTDEVVPVHFGCRRLAEYPPMARLGLLLRETPCTPRYASVDAAALDPLLHQLLTQ